MIRAAAPDLVILQEATDPRIVARLASACGMTQWGSQPRGSLAYLSREPVAHAAWHRPRVSRHAFLEVAPAARNVRVFGVHLSAVHAAWTERRRIFELRALLRAIATHQHGFHVLAGDFNTLAPGERLELRALPRRLRLLVWLSGGRVRWRTIQSVLNAHYVDAFRSLHPEQTGFTFPVWSPHVRLDYVFVPAAFTDHLRSCEILTGGEALAASDHLPLLAQFAIPPRA